VEPHSGVASTIFRARWIRPGNAEVPETLPDGRKTRSRADDRTRPCESTGVPRRLLERRRVAVEAEQEPADGLEVGLSTLELLGQGVQVQEAS